MAPSCLACYPFVACPTNTSPKNKKPKKKILTYSFSGSANFTVCWVKICNADFIRFHLFLHVLIFSSQHNQCQPAMTFVILLTRIPKTRNNENLKQKTQNSKWKILKKNSKHKTKQKHTCFSLYSYCFLFFWTIIASSQIDLVCYPNNKNSMGRG